MNNETLHNEPRLHSTEDPRLEGNCKLPKCQDLPVILEFRKPFTYDGSFCIDWLRDDYKDKSFDYEALTNEYEKLEELTTESRKYFVPHLLINTGQSIKLSLKITTLNSKPNRLEFFTDNQNTLSLEKAYEIYPDEDYIEGKELTNILKVTCNKEISQGQNITVKADSVLVGKINVVPNQIISGPKIIFVAVKLDGITFNINERELTTRLFKQCAVNLTIGSDELSLNLTNEENRFLENFFYTDDVINAYFYPELFRFLDAKFDQLIEVEKYKDFQKVYFINKEAKAVTQEEPPRVLSDEVKGVTSFPPQKKGSSIMIFKSGFEGNTLAHEILHSLGLPHSFETDPLGYTYHSFERNTTTNVMDYIGFKNSGKNLYNLWYWQIKKIREFSNSL